MICKYKAKVGEEIICSGGLFVENQDKALQKIFKKIRERTKGQLVFSNNLSIEINGELVFSQSKVFEKPVYEKLQTRVKAPWLN